MVPAIRQADQMAAGGGSGVQVTAATGPFASLVRLSALPALSVKLTLTFSVLPWSAVTAR